MIVKGAFALASRGRLSVMIFHRVLAAADPLLPSEPTAAQFEALLKHLGSRFSVLPLIQAVRRLYDDTLPAGSLAITFDDGYADNLSVAAPILHRVGMPATVFVATAYLDGGCMFNDRVREAVRATPLDRLDLTAEGLGVHSLASIEDRRAAVEAIIGAIKYVPAPDRDAKAQSVVDAARVRVRSDLMLERRALPKLFDFGLDVGAHTVRHPILANTTPTDAWREISDSKRDLEALTGRPVPLFAYPNGVPGKDYMPDHVRMVREAGFDAACTTSAGAASAADDRFQLPRFTPWSRRPTRFDLQMLRNLRRARR